MPSRQFWVHLLLSKGEKEIFWSVKSGKETPAYAGVRGGLVLNLKY
jgi:hypothetical protein